MELRTQHWVVALGLALIAHLSLAVLLFHEQRQEGAQAVGLGGIEVSLGPAGGTPGEAGAAIEPDLAETETEPVTEAPTMEPELETTAVEIPEAVEQVTEPVQELESVQAEELVVPEPVVPPVVRAETPVDEVRAREFEPTPPKPKPQPPKPRPKPPEPEPAPQPKPPAPAPAPSAEPSQQARTAPAGTQGEAGTEQRSESGSGDATPGGGLPGATADYFAHLRAWLERHKRYPRGARLRRQEGTAHLRFVIDRQGRVLSYRLEQSSGHRLLDNEVEEMIQRASPLPAMPDEIHQAQLEVVVPVSFSLR